MSDFNAALEHLLSLEGYPGYSNDPSDHGGETFAGIARRYWQGWPGWPIVDAHHGDRKAMAADKQLRAAVGVFYRVNFWTPYMERMQNQGLAEWLFQMSVNCGRRQATKFIQRALGVTDDGVWGHGTEDALNRANTAEVLDRARKQAQQFYTALAAKSPDQERFLRGWINRANA